MDISLSIVGLSAGAASPVDSLVGNLAKIRDEGFRRVWMAQMPWDADLTTVLGIAFREVDGIEIGSAVIPIQSQHPMQLAQRALTLSLISGGRFKLGIGMSHRMVTEGMWGVSWDRALRQMREYLDGLQPLLAGEPADATGEFWTARGALQIPAPEPELYIAALGPQMLRLTGRRTAGTLTWMTGPGLWPNMWCPRCAARRPRPDVRSPRCGWRPRCRSASPTTSTAPASMPPRSSRSTAPCRHTARCSTARATPDPKTRPSSATRKRSLQRIDELSAAGVDEFTGSLFDASAEGRARTRALLLRLRAT